LSAPQIALRLRASPPGSLFFFGRLEFHPCAARFRNPYGNGLPGGARAVLAFAYVMHLFAHKFSSLCGRGLAFPRIFTCPFQSFFFRHDFLSSEKLDAMLIEQDGAKPSEW
jgi:hypothetical protein